MLLRKQTKISWLLLLGLLGSACEEEASTDASLDAGVDSRAETPNDDAASAPSDGGAQPAASDAKVGEFSVQLVAPVPASPGGTDTPGFTALLGSVYDGPEVPAVQLVEELEADDCVLLTPKVPFCEQGCKGAICVADDVCQQSPKLRDPGTVVIKGLRTDQGPTDITLKPINGIYQAPGNVTLPFPAFAEGAELSLSAMGGDVGTFALQTKGVAPLQVAADKPYPIASGQPLELTWTPPADPSASRIAVKLDISHHGGSKGEIRCQTADDGSLTIAESLMTKLIGLGVAGFPTVVVERASVGSTMTAVGRVDLRSYSRVEQGIEIPGVVSCTANEECPSGQSCRDDKTCG